MADNPPDRHRNVIRITARDSPNVALALRQIEAGLEPTGEVVTTGVLTWAEYQHRLAVWDPVRICVGIEATFWEGKDVLLYPPEWLNFSEDRAEDLKRQERQRGLKRIAKGLGIDPAEGGDETSLAVVDEWGLLDLSARKTPNTSVIQGEVVAMMRKWNLLPSQVVFDRGGGGKQIADRMRHDGFEGVRTVAFGESILPDIKRSKRLFPEKTEQREDRYVYFNRRAEMYHELRLLIDPDGPSGGWGIGAEQVELRRQLAVIPLLYDQEGRIRMLPKNKSLSRTTEVRESREKTLTELLGRSPDLADSVVLAVHGMIHEGVQTVAGAL